MDKINIDRLKGLSKKRLGKLYTEKCYIDQKTGYYRFNDSHIFVHEWIMEKKLGRKLKPGEVINHINGNKLDNLPSNLMIFEDKDEHTQWHQEQLELSAV